MWQLFIVLYFIFGAANYLLRRVLAQKIGEHNRLINAIFYIFFLLPAGILLSFFFPHNLHVGALNILLLFSGGIIWPLYYVAAFNANKKVDVGIFSIINNLSPLFTLLIALPFLHQQLLEQQYVGIVLLICSGILAAYAQIKNHARASTNGIAICILSAAVMGVAVAYESFMLGRIDFGAYLVYGWGSQVLWSAILTGSELKKIPLLLRKGSEMRGILIRRSIASTLSSISFIAALKISANASLVSAASDFMSVAVVIAAYFYLKEREHMLRKWMAVIIGILGLLLIAT